MPAIHVPHNRWSSLATAARLVLMGAYPKWDDETLAIEWNGFTFVQPAAERWIPQIMLEDPWRTKQQNLQDKIVVDIGAFIGDSSIAYAIGRVAQGSGRPPYLSSTPDPESNPNHSKEIGHEEAFFRRTDHRFPARGRCRDAHQGSLSPSRVLGGELLPVWRGKFGGMDVSGRQAASRPSEAENAKLKKLLSRGHAPSGR